jgi:hypothetical protein
MEMTHQKRSRGIWEENKNQTVSSSLLQERFLKESFEFLLGDFLFWWENSTSLKSLIRL